MEHEQHEHHQHVALAVFATAVVTAIIVGVLVFNFQEKRCAERQINANTQLELAGDVVQNLQEEKEAVEQEAAHAKEQVKKVSGALKEISAEKSKAIEQIKLPLIRYEREGLLTTEERALLEEKLVGPYIAYYNLEESNSPVITLDIEVPEKKGDAYLVDAIHETGANRFVFEKRGEQMEFWKPECMGPCIYPKIFTEKYPQLVEKTQ